MTSLMHDSGSASDEKRSLLVVAIYLIVISVAVMAVILTTISIGKYNAEVAESNASMEQAQEKAQSTTEAVEKCHEIDELYELGAISREQVISAYEYELLSDDAIYNVNIAVCYAQFIDENDGDVIAAATILEAVEELPDDESTLLLYYNELASLYGEVDDQEKVDYYNAKAEEYVVVDSRSVEEIEKGEQ